MDRRRRRVPPPVHQPDLFLPRHSPQGTSLPANNSQRFKDLAAKEEGGDGMIAVFGNETIQVLNRYIGEHNSMVERSRRR